MQSKPFYRRYAYTKSRERTRTVRHCKKSYILHRKLRISDKIPYNRHKRHAVRQLVVYHRTAEYLPLSVSYTAAQQGAAAVSIPSISIVPPAEYIQLLLNYPLFCDIHTAPAVKIRGKLRYVLAPLYTHYSTSVEVVENPIAYRSSSVFILKRSK